MTSKPQRDVIGFLKNNGLSLACFALFAAFLVGQSMTGWHVHNADAVEHGGRAIAFTTYLTTGHFFEALFENWESEFLQMGSFVLLTAYLYQRGSAESKDPDEGNDAAPNRRVVDGEAPWPVRKGGLWLRLYANSLLLAFTALFLLSILGHALGGVREYNSEQRDHHNPEISTLQYVRTAQFWFESFQNWQSEFLAVGSIVVLTIFLRQRGSPESKPITMTKSEMPTA